MRYSPFPLGDRHVSPHKVWAPVIRTFLQMTADCSSDRKCVCGGLRHQSGLWGELIYWNINLFSSFLDYLLPSLFYASSLVLLGFLPQGFLSVEAACSAQLICILWGDTNGISMESSWRRRGNEQVSSGTKGERGLGQGQTEVVSRGYIF